MAGHTAAEERQDQITDTQQERGKNRLNLYETAGTQEDTTGRGDSTGAQLPRVTR